MSASSDAPPRGWPGFGIANERRAHESPAPFDFSVLQQFPLSLKLDVGASAYWSEIASVQALDNLLAQDKIDLEEYLERLPDGYVPKKQALIEKRRAQREREEAAQMAAAQMSQMGQMGDPLADPLMALSPAEPLPPELPVQ